MIIFVIVVAFIPIWIGEMQQDAEVAYSRAVGEELVEGKYSFVAGTCRADVIGEGRGG